MLFKDILVKKTNKLHLEFIKLFDDILKNQTHDGDLLLIRVNGFYNPEVYNWNIEEKMSPYVIGPGKEGHSEYLHYQFIHNYRTQAISDLSYPDYKKKIEWSLERKTEINELFNIESMSIQMEMLIYLKIWEADLFIKKLYQITRLSLGEPYDWHFSIAESNRDSEATGTREKIIRKKIRDRLQKKYPEIFLAIKNAYQTQIRNSIAHSKYSFQGRHIHLNNFIKEDKAAQLKSISFDKWISMFHDTMVLYNLLINFFNKVDDFYSEMVKNNELVKEIRIERKYPEKRTEYNLLKYRPEWNDWYWKKNDK